MQMKRYAGENGVCYASQKTLCEKLRIATKTYRKSINYLVEHGWITHVGMTEAKTRPINTYRVNDIWKMNVDHYEEKRKEKIASESQDQKDTVPRNTISNQKDTEPGNSKILSQGTTIKNKSEEEPKYQYNGKKSKLREMPNIPIPKEQQEYIASEIHKALKDDKSKRYYSLVAAKVPEGVIRQALSEIKVDGANHPGKVFTHRMESYAGN